MVKICIDHHSEQASSLICGTWSCFYGFWSIALGFPLKICASFVTINTPLLEAAGLHLYSLAQLMLFVFFVSNGSLFHCELHSTEGAIALHNIQLHQKKALGSRASLDQFSYNLGWPRTSRMSQSSQVFWVTKVALDSSQKVAQIHNNPRLFQVKIHLLLEYFQVDSKVILGLTWK